MGGGGGGGGGLQPCTYIRDVPVSIRLVMNVLAHIWVTVLTLVSCC